MSQSKVFNDKKLLLTEIFFSVITKNLNWKILIEIFLVTSKVLSLPISIPFHLVWHLLHQSHSILALYFTIQQNVNSTWVYNLQNIYVYVHLHLIVPKLRNII